MTPCDILKISHIKAIDTANQFSEEGAFSDFSLLDKEIQDMITKLSKTVEEIDEKNVHYSFKDLMPHGALYHEAKLVLNRDLQLLQRSKGFMIISPYNKVFSSCWVMAGWAIVLKIPTFIVYREEENLPYILRQANVLEWVHLQKLKEDSLDSIPYWFVDNKFGPRYFK